MKTAAGTLLYRRGPDGLEVLLVHASGNYNRRAPWGIPKGGSEEGEDLETTARRETLEETGVEADELISLGEMTYRKSRKTIHAFGGLAPDNAEPTVASWEIDQARFVPVDEAREIIHPDQCVFIDRLVEKLGQ